MVGDGEGVREGKKKTRGRSERRVVELQPPWGSVGPRVEIRV